MNEVRSTLEYLLTNDVMVQALVGRDEAGFIKVYEVQATPGTQAPFTVWTLLPGLPPAGHFGNLEGIFNVDFQLSSWGRDRDEAWQLWAAVSDVMKGGEWDPHLVPYTLIDVSRLDSPGAIPDEETSWWQVPNRWRARVST